jgi:hypothetical protein
LRRRVVLVAGDADIAPGARVHRVIHEGAARVVGDGLVGEKSDGAGRIEGVDPGRRRVACNRVAYKNVVRLSSPPNPPRGQRPGIGRGFVRRRARFTFRALLPDRRASRWARDSTSTTGRGAYASI